MIRCIVFFVLCVCSAVAEPTLILTEASLAERIHEQNPDLKAARWKIQEALGKWQQAGRPSRPRLDWQWEQTPDMREGQVKLGVSRSFPITQRLAWEKEISKSSLEAAEWEIRRAEQELITEARLIFIQALALKSRRQCMVALQEEAAAFAEEVKKNQQRAEASALDAAQAKLDAASLLIEQKQLDAQEVALFASLKKLLGMQPADTISAGGELPALHDAAAGHVSQRADYQQALREVLRARNTVQSELASRFDDLEAGVYFSGMRMEDAPQGYRSDVMLGFQLSIPLPFWDDNSGNIAAAKAGVERREREAQAILAHAQNEASGATAEMREWKKLDQQITSELLPLAEEQLKLAQQAYAGGQGELATIFRARAQKRQLTLARIDARSSYHQSRIRSESARAAQP
jgi:cobalt-zinc-cadmium efflux system outer membrane protein